MVRKVQKSKKMKKVVVQTRKAEVTAIGRALRALGGLGGGYVGSMLGSGTAGASIGHGLGGQLSRWLGQGDYEVRSNSLLKQGGSGVIPAMHKNGQSIIVRHKEFITEVTGKTAFTVQKRLSINPGLSATFPWLSGVAAQYSEYSVKGMVYHYVPTSGNAVSSTNAALGTVMLQTSYRANEDAPVSKVEMLNEYWSNEAKPSEEFCHPIECDPNENPFNVQYVRTTDVAGTDSILLYDLGTTTLAVSGQQADDIVLGDLWVTYEIELRKPRVTFQSGDTIPGLSTRATTNINTTTPFGTNVESLDTLVGGGTVSGTAITMGRGNTGTYSVSIWYPSATAVSLSTIAVTGAGSTLINSLQPLLTTGVSYIVTVILTITQPNTVTVITPTFATLAGASACRVILTKINPALAAPP